MNPKTRATGIVCTLQVFVVLCFVYALSCFSFVYFVYKHHNFDLVPGDHGPYMDMAARPFVNDVGNPYKYRVLTPAIAHAVAHVIPGYHTPTTTDSTTIDRRLLLAFCLVNFAFLCAAAAIIAYLLARHFALPWWASVCGGFLSMCAFPSVVTAIVPATDAGALFFCALAYLAFAGKHRALFACSVVLGVLQKETVGVVVLGFLVIDAIAERRIHPYWFAMWALSVAMHIAYKALVPSPGFEEYYQPGAIVSNALSVLNPSTYTGTVLRHNVLSNAPLIAAGLAHAVLRARGGAPLAFPVRYLWLIPYLFVFGMAFVPPNNVMRLMALAGLFTVGYQVAVLGRVWEMLAGYLPRSAATT